MPSTDAASDATPPAHATLYVSGYGPDIAWYDFDTGAGTLAPRGSLAAPQPSFLALTPAHLFAVNEGGDRVGAYALDPATGALTFLNDQSSQGAGPAHVSVDRAGRFALVANYGGGTVAVLPIGGDGRLAPAIQTVVAGANAHMIVTAPQNRFVFVPCKGADYIAQYTFDPASGMLAANSVPHATTVTGAGPRHLAFAPDGRHAYVIDENASTLIVFGYDTATGRLATQQTVSTRAPGATGANTGAEVVVHPSGKFVYGSNRGDDDIAVFAVAGDGTVTWSGHAPTGGKTPRSFTIDPSGRWLLAANQGSGSVVVFAIDGTTGALAATGTPITAAMPAFVGFAPRP